MARMTSFHKELLVEFIEKNNVMVKGKVSQKEESRQLWEELANKLTQSGAVKRSGNEWKKAWGELLCRTKKLALIYINSNNEKKITPLDHRILAAGQGNMETRVRLSKNTKRLIKKYTTKESVSESSDFDKEIGVKIKNKKSDHPNIDDVDYSDTISSSHKTNKISNTLDYLTSMDISELYPKWLIDIEQKRADAELLNASSASKNAEAALLQAQALQKLADAASLQAEAIMKIVKVLESSGSRSVVL